METRCPYCGVKLTECENGLYCPNHGIVYPTKKKEEDEDKHKDYIG